MLLGFVRSADGFGVLELLASVSARFSALWGGCLGLILALTTRHRAIISDSRVVRETCCSCVAGRALAGAGCTRMMVNNDTLEHVYFTYSRARNGIAGFVCYVWIAGHGILHE
jgi:hypothetical protein